MLKDPLEEHHGGFFVLMVLEYEEPPRLFMLQCRRLMLNDDCCFPFSMKSDWSPKGEILAFENMRKYMEVYQWYLRMISSFSSRSHLTFQYIYSSPSSFSQHFTFLYSPLLDTQYKLKDVYNNKNKIKIIFVIDLSV